MKHKVQWGADTKPPVPVNIANQSATFANSIQIEDEIPEESVEETEREGIY